eukprot:CAMPEP_0201575480 /NCGR_PEP_ID=MMETSP0190_2-20130828/20702_1 /ASSEMBLY_ACC=CAM_ASM_000263 /TAXON_ID=37353 /ORGANISM="Rosalina sp." /LENGTH=149 /DNA_ID=CAMNT_0048005153 /DNA_START=14 /DNA_END=464 /DNA_ORIENTATION=-
MAYNQLNAAQGEISIPQPIPMPMIQPQQVMVQSHPQPHPIPMQMQAVQPVQPVMVVQRQVPVTPQVIVVQQPVPVPAIQAPHNERLLNMQQQTQYQCRKCGTTQNHNNRTRRVLKEVEQIFIVIDVINNGDEEEMVEYQLLACSPLYAV